MGKNSKSLTWQPQMPCICQIKLWAEKRAMQGARSFAEKVDVEDQSIPVPISAGGEWTKRELWLGCKVPWTWSFPGEGNRSAGQGSWWSYSSFGKDWSSASPEQCSSPKHHVLLPLPEHVTPESTKESCSASQWQDSNIQIDWARTAGRIDIR